MKKAARRTAIVVGVLLAVTLRWFDVNPLILETTEAEQKGVSVHDDSPADVLLIVDPEIIDLQRRGGRFEWNDWSYGWLNLLEQEVGRFAVVGPSDVRLGALDGRRVVIVSKSAVRATELWLPRFKTFVTQGGLLMLERPGSAWASLCGVETSGGETPITTLTRLPAGLDPALAADLEGMPWHTKPLALDGRADSPSEIALEADGHPIATTRRVGKGVVITLGLDVGRQVTTLQQGTPDPGSFEVVNRYSEVLSDNLATSDLVASRRMLQSAVPYSDLFERLIFGLLEAAGPIPRWWSFPDAAPGGYLVTHDDEGQGDKGTWMAKAEEGWEVPSTYFVMPGDALTAQGAAELSRPMGGVGLHQVTMGALEDGPFHEFGVWKVNPARRAWSLQEQSAWLEERLGRPPRLSRSHLLLWGDDYARPFRRLAAAGITLDSSYGPDVETAGYLFGTGLPFIALDDNGHPLPIRELPFVVAEDLGGADRKFLFRLLKESADRYHQFVTVLFHPNVFQWRPDPDIYRNWRDSFTYARGLGLWIGSMEQVADLIAARRGSALTSNFDNGLLVVSVDVRRKGTTLALPAVWRGRASGPITLDNEPVKAARVRNLGGDLLLVALETGAHSLIVDYPETDAAP